MAAPLIGAPPQVSQPNFGGSRLPRGFSALRHRNYRLFFTGQLISVTGTWMQTVAQSWLVLTLTSSALKLGLVNVCQFAPMLVLGLFAGVAADRFPKRSLLVITQSASALLAALLAVLVWTDRVQLWHVYALALGLGVVNALDMPTRQAFVVEMVGKEDLMNAIALNSSLFNAARAVGPALAGIFVASFGTAICFGINAVSYLAAIVGLLMMRFAHVRAIRAGNGVARLREGVRYVRVTPTVLLPVIMVGFVATFGMNFQLWVPLLAKHEFAVGAGGFGVLTAALGLGSVAGALSLAFFGRGARAGLMLGMAAVLGAVELLLAAAGAIPLPIATAFVLLALLGYAMTTTMAMANTIVQTSVPDDLRGRVMSVYLTVFAGTAPFGALVVGALANALGTPASIAIGGTITLLAVTCVAIAGGVFRKDKAAAPVQQPAVTNRRRLPSSSGGED